MATEKPSVMDVLVKAFEDSNGETIDLVTEHEELRGLTPDMMDWWMLNACKSDNYRKWYPQDHIAFIWEVPPTKAGLDGAVSVVVESIGEFTPSPLRIRPEDPPGWSSISDPDDRRIAWLHDEAEVTPTGIKLRTTFRCPAKTPRKFLDAFLKHSLEENARFAEFLPEMYRKANG
jgi:hypothetical protein